jgi:hypothetical protein
VRALQDAANRWGVGSTAAHLLGGHRGPHADLEREVAHWLGYESALLFSTGYLANLGVIAGLMHRGDVCVQDKLNHACLIDGATLAGCDLRRYPHNDVDAAARQLDAAGRGARAARDRRRVLDGRRSCAVARTGRLGASARHAAVRRRRARLRRARCSGAGQSGTSRLDCARCAAAHGHARQGGRMRRRAGARIARPDRGAGAVRATLRLHHGAAAGDGRCGVPRPSRSFVANPSGARICGR